VVSPEDTIDNAYHNKKAVSYRGVALITSHTVVAAHPSDRVSHGETTIHELVHTFDIKNKISDTQLPDYIHAEVLAQISSAVTLAQAWNNNEPLDTWQQQDIRHWQELLKSASQEELELLNPFKVPPDDPGFGRYAYTKYVNALSGMIDLDEKIYETELEKRREYLPRYEEAARIYNNDPLDPNSMPRKLCNFICPSIGEFIEHNYLPALQHEYDQALARKQFIITPRPVLPLHAVKPPRMIEDQAFEGEKLKELHQLRFNMLRVLLEADNFHLQPDTLEKQDEAIARMREFYEQAFWGKQPGGMSPESAADLMATREMLMLKRAIEKARHDYESKGKGRQ
jgi:hypothetical protein